MKKLFVTAAAAALASAGYCSTFFDTFSTYPGTTFGGSSWEFTMTAGVAYTNEMTLTGLGPISSINFALFNTTSAPINVTSTNPLDLLFYNNNAGAVGTFITGYALTFGSALAANTGYNITLAFGTPITLAASSNTIWTGFEAPSQAGLGIGIGSTAATGTAFDNQGVSPTGYTGAFTVTNSPYSAQPTADFAMVFNAAPAPEPVSMAFLGLGVIGLIVRRRRG